LQSPNAAGLMRSGTFQSRASIPHSPAESESSPNVTTSPRGPRGRKSGMKRRQSQHHQAQAETPNKAQALPGDPRARGRHYDIKLENYELPLSATPIKDFRKALYRRYRSLTRGWRMILDPDNTTQLSPEAFAKGTQELGFWATGGGELFILLDRDEKGFVCLEDIDPDAAAALTKFKHVMSRLFGSVVAGFQLALQMEDNTLLSYQSFVSACRARLFLDPQSLVCTKRLFDALDFHGQGVVTMDSAEFLDQWMPLGYDEAPEVCATFLNQWALDPPVSAATVLLRPSPDPEPPQVWPAADTSSDEEPDRWRAGRPRALRSTVAAGSPVTRQGGTLRALRPPTLDTTMESDGRSSASSPFARAIPATTRGRWLTQTEDRPPPKLSRRASVQTTTAAPHKTRGPTFVRKDWTRVNSTAMETPRSARAETPRVRPSWVAAGAAPQGNVLEARLTIKRSEMPEACQELDFVFGTLLSTDFLREGARQRVGAPPPRDAGGPRRLSARSGRSGVRKPAGMVVDI